MSADRFIQMKKSMADSRGFKTGEDGLDYLLAQLLEGLLRHATLWKSTLKTTTYVC